MFIAPGEEIYEGMIVGEANKNLDLAVNVVRAKQQTNTRSSNKDTTVVLKTPRVLTLENCLEFINEDEFSYTVSTDNKIYTIYDKELVRVGTIDLNNYDFDNQVIIKKIGTNYVLSDGIYFNEELEQVETIKEYTMKKDTYGLKVSTENVVSVLIEDKVIGTYDYVYPNEMYNEMEDGTFYYISDDSYVTIKKVNE